MVDVNVLVYKEYTGLLEDEVQVNRVGEEFVSVKLPLPFIFPFTSKREVVLYESGYPILILLAQTFPV